MKIFYANNTNIKKLMKESAYSFLYLRYVNTNLTQTLCDNIVNCAQLNAV